MADRRCGLRLEILVLGSLLPAVLVKFGAGNFHICYPSQCQLHEYGILHACTSVMSISGLL